MSRLAHITMTLCLIAGMGFAQGDGYSDYDSMRVEAGIAKGSFSTGAIDELSGGARITLLPKEDSGLPLPIRAETMTFTYEKGQTMPAVIVMNTNVEVKHPDATITAQHAEWSYSTGEVVFTGRPVAKTAAGMTMNGQKISINFTTGGFLVENPEAEVPLEGQAASPADALAYGESDVLDWSTLLNTFKKAQADTPAAQALAQMNEDARQALVDTPAEVLLSRKSDIVKQLNKVVESPGLYSQKAWAGVALNEEAKALLAKESLTPVEQIKLNRLLLHAAYPAILAAP